MLRAEEILPSGPGVLSSGRSPSPCPATGRDARAEAGGGGPGGDCSATRTHVFPTLINSIGWISRAVWPGPSPERPDLLYRFRPTARGPCSAQPSAILRLSRFPSGFTDGSSLPFDRLNCGGGSVGGWNVSRCRPSIIMVRLAFETVDRSTGRAILPHEVAHQWWMGTVFPATGMHISFRGVVRIPAILFGEASGRAGRRDTATAPVAPLISKVKSGPRSARHGRDIRTVLTYLKAAYVHHTRKPIEPDVPEAAGSLRTVYRQGSPRSTISGSSELTGRDLGWFFRNGCGKVPARVYNVRSLAMEDGGGDRSVVVGYERYTAGVLPNRTAALLGRDHRRP